MATFAERLRELRKSKGLSQAELAQELDVAMNTVSIWELGKLMPEDNTIKRIAGYFHVTERYLLGESEFGTLESMIAELKRRKGWTDENTDETWDEIIDGSDLEKEILTMFRDFSASAQKAFYDATKMAYEDVQEHGRLRSQQESSE